MKYIKYINNSRRLWRKFVKKQQRKRRRQTVARQRDKELQEGKFS